MWSRRHLRHFCIYQISYQICMSKYIQYARKVDLICMGDPLEWMWLYKETLVCSEKINIIEGIIFLIVNCVQTMFQYSFVPLSIAFIFVLYYKQFLLNCEAKNEVFIFLKNLLFLKWFFFLLSLIYTNKILIIFISWSQLYSKII